MNNKPRIKSSYCPGAGDKGSSNLSCNSRSTKLSIVANVYSSAETLQGSLANLLSYNTSMTRLQKVPILSTLSAYLGFQSIQTKECIYIFNWLEQALFSLQSFVYCQGDSVRHSWSQDFLYYLDKYIITYKHLAESQEFQAFSSHKNLMLLNDLRIHTRQLELAYIDWKESLTPSPEIQESLDLHQAILNRLSAWLWTVIQQERIALKISPSYWVSSAPTFTKPKL